MKHRLTLFSDAVFAIIITLMVLDLHALFGTVQAVLFIALTFVFLPAAIAVFLAALTLIIASIDIPHEPA